MNNIGTKKQPKELQQALEMYLRKLVDIKNVRNLLFFKTFFSEGIVTEQSNRQKKPQSINESFPLGGSLTADIFNKQNTFNKKSMLSNKIEEDEEQDLYANPFETIKKSS